MGDKRPFKKLFCDREDLFKIPPTALKIWLYHYKCEQKDRKSWPSLNTLVEKCCMSKRTVVTQRKWLIDNGWLQKVGERTPFQKKYPVPEFRVTRGAICKNDIQNQELICKNDIRAVCKNSEDRMQKLHTEVDLEPEVDQFEVEGADMPKRMDRYQSDIAQIAWNHFNITLSSDDKSWPEMYNKANIVGGQHIVIEAFEDFAKANKGSITWPLNTFLGKFDSYAKQVEIEQERGADGAALIVALAKIADGRVTFKEKAATGIRILLEKYSESEIKSSFSEFLDSLDDRDVRFAGINFAETAGQLIEVQRERRKKDAWIAAQVAEMEATPVVVPDEEPFEDIKL